MPTYTAYPTPAQIAQLDGSVRVVRDDLVAMRSQNGALKVRAMYPAPKSGFVLKHLMTTAQYNDFVTFYGSYSRTFFDLLFAGDSAHYTCCFAQPPQYTFQGLLVDVQVQLEQQ